MADRKKRAPMPNPTDQPKTGYEDGGIAEFFATVMKGSQPAFEQPKKQSTFEPTSVKLDDAVRVTVKNVSVAGDSDNPDICIVALGVYSTQKLQVSALKIGQGATQEASFSPPSDWLASRTAGARPHSGPRWIVVMIATATSTEVPGVTTYEVPSGDASAAAKEAAQKRKQQNDSAAQDYVAKNIKRMTFSLHPMVVVGPSPDEE